jgi:putative transposase
VLGLWASAARWFYNQAVQSQLDRHRHGVKIESLMSLAYAVRAAREAGVTFRSDDGIEHQLTEVPAVVLHGALRQLSGAWTRHLRALSEGKARGLPVSAVASSPPGFRSRGVGSSVMWQLQEGGGPVPLAKLITTDGGRHARVGKTPRPLGPVMIRYHRPLPGDALAGFLVLREENGRYWLTVQYETALARQAAGAGIMGIDRGVAVTLATSDGRAFNTPGLPPGQQTRMLRLQRSLSRRRRLNACQGDPWVMVNGRNSIRRGPCPGGDGCWKSSRRYQRCKAAYVGLRQREAAMRSDAAHKASRVIADSCEVAVFEDLDVSAMTRSAKGTAEKPGRHVRQKAGLNREITAAGWYQVEAYTGYKVRKLVKVPAHYSSQTCPQCGHVCAANRPSRDVFRCSECSFSGHADVVAAGNLAARYGAATAGACPAEAREIRDRVGERPVNPHPSKDRPEHRGGGSQPGKRSRAAQEVCQAAIMTGPLVPASWGIGIARRSRIAAGLAAGDHGALATS